MNGLEVRQIKKHGFLSRLFRRTDRRNAIVALQNVLATTAISEIPPDAVDRVFEQYRLSRRVAEQALCDIYADVLRYCAQDEELPDAETADLRRLGELFGLSDAQVRGAERTVLAPMYRGLKHRYSDGIGVAEDTGKDQVFTCNGDNEIVCATLAGALRNADA
jgi:hypothetical protein